VLDTFALKIKRGDTPFYASLNTLARNVISANLPIPRLLHPCLRLFYDTHQNSLSALRWTKSYFYCEPLFRGRCESIGKRFSVEKMPFVVGHAKITVGNDVNFFGKVDIFSGRIFDEPRLAIGNRVDVGHGVSFIVNKRIDIEDDVNIASGATFMDSDSHPKDMDDRIADLPPKPEEIRPIRICRGSWIGRGSIIMKGVTVGEGAIVGANSVVLVDVPARSIAIGNPARVVMKNI
jgi:acetyltransferase-like isoleucine patch superfamily enzyme